MLSIGRAAELETAPLAPRSKPDGGTMFTRLSPQQTGIVTENRYADPRMWGELNQEFAVGAIGTGVSVGDYDNDGRPDAFIVSKTGQSRLFRNLGGWKFEDTTERAGMARAGGTLEKGLSWVKGWIGSAPPELEPGPWTQGAAFADVNNDGWLDLYVCRFAAANLLYINQRDGTFQEEAVKRGLAVVDASGMGNFCDYDRDGWMDVYVQTNMLNATKAPNGQRDYLFHNRGDGTFENVTVAAGISGESLAHSATWWDYDEDGWPDLYVANDFGPADRLYRNNRNGTFTDVVHEVVPQMSYSAMGTDLGDVNNDGRIDFLVGDMAATTHAKDQRGMATSRELNREDSDSATVSPQILRNVLYLNTGVGRFQEAGAMAGLAATDWTWSVRFEDLDNDSRLDLHVTNGMIREYNNADLRDKIIVAENPVERTRLMKVSPVLNEKNLVYRNLGDVQFEETGKSWGLDQLGVSFGTAFGDFDGDGDLDLIVADYETGATLLRNDGSSGRTVIVALRGKTSNRFGIGAKVRLVTSSGVQVRELTLGRGYLSSSEPVVHFGLGKDTQIARLTIEWPSGHAQEFTNLEVDRRYTITEPMGAAEFKVPRPPAPGQFVNESELRGLSLASEESFHPDQQPLLPIRFDRRGPALAVADLNGDQKIDVVLGGTGKQRTAIHAGADRFSPWFELPAAEVDDGPLLAFDADGDGRTDLLQTRSGTNRPAGSPDYQPVLYRNEPTGFAPVADALPPWAGSVGAAAAADFDRDGRLDVFLGGRVLPGRYPLAPKSALLRNHGGRFDDVTDTMAPGIREVGMVSSALWTDVDQDGWLDLLLALEWGGVRFWRNDNGRGFVDRSDLAGFSAAGTGWWTSLCSGDFNADGRMDYAVGNAGLNTPYTSPAYLFSGRFGTGGATQLIEAHREDNRLYPRRTIRALSAQIPALKRRYPSNDDYGRASLGEILGDAKLTAAQRFEATQLQSGVFLSQADGTYRFQALPRMAQIAPLQGLVAGDFDGDGHSDLYAVQNSYAPIPLIGRFDGGLSQLLLGDGKGGFTAVAPARSGLIVPGDAKALVVVDLNRDGWADFLVSRNHTTTLAWRNTGIAGRNSFRVTLAGRAGNPSAIGAQVSVELQDGTKQHQEIAAGSGYYSQSEAACFFGYVDGNVPRRVVVRWPDGKVSEKRFTSPPPSVLLLTAE
jgi:hypothetical protein